MLVSPISNNYSPNFEGVTRIRMKDGSTAVLNVLGEPRNAKITEISGDIWSKGAVVGKINYHNKKGFSVTRMLEIIENLRQKAADPDCVINNIYDALITEEEEQ